MRRIVIVALLAVEAAVGYGIAACALELAPVVHRLRPPNHLTHHIGSVGQRTAMHLWIVVRRRGG
jgi:hypothetical protein